MNYACKGRMGHPDLFSLFYALIFRLCAKQCIFFLSCTPTDYIMLMGLFKWRRHAAMLTDGRSAYKAKVVSRHLGEKILKLVSDVELLPLKSNISTQMSIPFTLLLLQIPPLKKSMHKNLKNLKLWPSSRHGK